MAAKAAARKVEVIAGKKYKYPCKKCRAHTLDCVTQEMWDAVSKTLYSKKK